MAAPQTVIQDAGERPLLLRSGVRGPMKELGFSSRALALAELAMIA